MTDLAKRAVACKGWRWMPGMLTLPWRDEFGDVSHPPWRLRTENWMPFADGHRGAIPDLTDPATLGCLLALVRERWGKMVYTVPICDDAGEIDHWLAVVPDPAEDSWEWPVFNATTETAALVAALEAAPKR